MPNHCYNILTIDGKDTEKIYELLSKGGEKLPCILHELYPTPEDLKIPSMGYFYTDLEHWIKLGRPDKYVNKYGQDIDLTDPFKDHDDSKQFSTMREYMERIESNVKTYGCGTWYEWNNTHWGTKWGMYDNEAISLEKDCVVISCQSAWGPPTEGLRHLTSVMDLEILLKYSESGLDFAGIVELKSGAEVAHMQTSAIIDVTDTPLSKDMWEEMCDSMEVVLNEECTVAKASSKWEDEDVEWTSAGDISYKDYLRLCKGGEVKWGN